MDMISFGPTLKNPHSPDEKIQVESIGKIWDFLVGAVEKLEISIRAAALTGAAFFIKICS